MIDLRDRPMKRVPWIRRSLNRDAEYQRKAIHETLIAFNACGGRTSNLLAALNACIPDRCYKISIGDFSDEAARCFSEEFYFYVMMLSKTILGREGFHFGEDPGPPMALSPYHYIYERGKALFPPWIGKNIKDEGAGFSFLNVRLPLLWLRARGEEPSELLSWFNSYFDEADRRDESFFDDEFAYLSTEACLLFHSLFVAYCGDASALRDAFHDYYASPEYSLWAQFFDVPPSRAVECILEMRKSTIPLFDETIEPRHGAIYWRAMMNSDAMNSQIGAYGLSGLRIGLLSNLGAIIATVEHVIGHRIASVSTNSIYEPPDRFGCDYLIRLNSGALKWCIPVVAIAALVFVTFALLKRHLWPSWALIGGVVFAVLGVVLFFILFLYRRALSKQQRLQAVSLRQLRLLRNACSVDAKFSSRASRAIEALSLTGREQEIVNRLLTGATTKEIAYDLGLSSRTVDNRLQAIYRKIGVRSRGELISQLLVD